MAQIKISYFFDKKLKRIKPGNYNAWIQGSTLTAMIPNCFPFTFVSFKLGCDTMATDHMPALIKVSENGNGTIIY